ncbi:MAG: glycosyltransferase [Microthrixaceae bacterium]|nr:glycosyltransferase [Microthrixaceae bacterium]
MEHPQWFSPGLREIFTPTVTAQLRYSELLVCAGSSTVDQIHRICEAEGLETPTVCTVPLGADVSAYPGEPGPHDEPPRSPHPVVPQGDRYLLMVGTVETRKNHLLALEVFEQLASEHPDLHLVVVGRYGWGAEDFLARFESHELTGKRLHWLTDVDDRRLEALYAGAHTVLVPSLAEGFGLPVVEALKRGGSGPRRRRPRAGGCRWFLRHISRCGCSAALATRTGGAAVESGAAGRSGASCVAVRPADVACLRGRSCRDPP